jgi:hypothetical protein
MAPEFLSESLVWFGVVKKTACQLKELMSNERNEKK